MGAVDWDALWAHPDVQVLVELALREDIGAGDKTTDAIFEEPRAIRGRVVARQASIACGVPFGAALLHHIDPDLQVTPLAPEGTRIEAGQALLQVEGDVRSLLRVERCLLNFLMRLCGVAHNAWQAAARLPEDSTARVYDTRKTLPGWRLLDKAAVRTGGCENHRVGLFDAVLIKDNHIAAAGGVRAAVERARQRVEAGIVVEVEIDTLAQLEEAVAAGADIVLLDNFSLEQLRQAVRQNAGRAVLEASGGVTLDTLGAIAATGVQRISMGWLTHTVVPAELGLDVV